MARSVTLRVSPQTTRRGTLAKYLLRLGDREVEAELAESSDGIRVKIDGTWHLAHITRLGASPRYSLSLNGQLLDLLVQDDAQSFNIKLDHKSFAVETGRRIKAKTREDSDSFRNGKWTLVAPLTGVIAETLVSPGQMVEAGQTLMVMEAMKMLNDLASKVTGKVTSVSVKAQDRVEIGTSLLVISEEPGDS